MLIWMPVCWRMHKTTTALEPARPVLQLEHILEQTPWPESRSCRLGPPDFGLHQTMASFHLWEGGGKGNGAAPLLVHCLLMTLDSLAFVKTPWSA